MTQLPISAFVRFLLLPTPLVAPALLILIYDDEVLLDKEAELVDGRVEGLLVERGVAALLGQGGVLVGSGGGGRVRVHRD